MNHILLINREIRELEEVSIVEGAMLELRGSNGILRMDLKEEELERMFIQSERENVKKERINRRDKFA